MQIYKKIPTLTDDPNKKNKKAVDCNALLWVFTFDF